MGTDNFLRLPTLAEIEAERAGQPFPKGLPPALAKEERRKSRETEEKLAREAVWARDHARSRATGQPLKRSGIDWNEIGEVDHVINRSTAPELVYDTANMLLLSRKENRLKKTACPRAPEHHMFEVSGPADRAKPQLFRWRDKDGKITRETRG